MDKDNNINQIVQLGRYGLVGVMLTLIATTAFFGWMLFKIASNHIEHNTAAQLEQAKALSELTVVIKSLK